MAQSHEVFKALFEAYADIPLANGSGHMSLSALVRFGADFGLFPHKVDFQTVQWLYNKECQARLRLSPLAVARGAWQGGG